MTQTTTISEERIETLRGSFLGALLRESDPEYDTARRVHNGLIDRRPALIASCRNTADVVDAVNFAREEGLEITVRGGGHSVAGRAVCDGGMMIDLAPMKAIYVDPKARTARAQPGVLWREFNRETQLHGLAVTGGVISTTGIAGLTLGGGFGWLMGKHGMAVDNLRSAEVVTARGEVLQANAEENPDLFWGLRGGGGNFGVVTSLEYDLHPVGPMVTGGVLVYPVDQAGEVLRFYRDFTSAGVPDDLTVFSGLLHAPDGSGMKICALILAHCGAPEEAEEAIRPLREFAAPIDDQVGPLPYSTLNSMLDDGFPRAALNYWKASFLNELTDEAIDTAVEQFRSAPSPMSNIVFEHFHGAVTRVPVEATAFPHRSEGHNMAVQGQWADPADSERNIAWCRETYAALEPYMAPARYVNYLGDDEGDDIAKAYGPVYERLRQVKAHYDPDNLFHHNQNIQPAG